MGTIKAEQGERTFQLQIRADAWPVLDERWSDISPEEGTELCVCSWCGKMIGTDELDPIREDHIDYCGGCEICEIAVRMWKTIPNPDCKAGQDLATPKEIILELRFHTACLSGLLDGCG